MQNYSSNVDLARAAALLLGSRRPIITTHSKPDPDAFGSAIALTAAVRKLGIEARAVFMPPVPAVFQECRGFDLSALFDSHLPLPSADLVVVVDTGAWSQLAPMKTWLEGRLDHTLILDHHLAGDVPAESRYIDTSAAASAEIVAQFIDEMESRTGHKLYDQTVCESLFMGIAADTGWFRFSNTRPFTLELAARLMKCGVDHSTLYARLEQSDRLEKLALMQRAVGSLKLVAEGRIAIMTLTSRDFDQTGALIEETERFVDLPQFARKVEAVALIVEPPDPPKGMTASSTGLNRKQMIRISFRSKPGPHAINVSKLAQMFGGGGHARAAGAKIDATLEMATQQVKEALLAEMKKQE